MSRLPVLAALAWLLAGCGPPCTDDASFFEASVAPMVTAECAGCHSPGGVAGGTRFVLAAGADRATRTANKETMAGLVGGDVQLLLEKPTGGMAHGGGQRFDVFDARYATLHEFVARTQAPGGCAHPGAPPPTCDPTVAMPGTNPLRPLSSSQIEASVSALLGVDARGVFPATAKGAGFRTWAANNPMTAATVESLMLAAEQVTDALDVPGDLGCDDGEDERACARRFVLRVAERAWRRPLTSAEQEEATAQLDGELSTAEALRRDLQGLLQSPQFLYLQPVPSSDTERGATLLDGHALAARLSLFLTDGPPDAALLADAAGGLRTQEEVAAHAARLVAGPQAVRAVAAFHEDWLDVHRLDGAQRFVELYPEYSVATYESIRTELDLFVSEVVWGGEATFASLLLDEHSWIDEELARIYGVAAPEDGWERVAFDPAERPGVLTRAAFLASHANAASSSPVARGAFVLQEMLCEELVPPQDVNMDLPEESPEAPTVRERLQQHWTDPTCAACHVRIDPLGLAFENYGALGEHRISWENGTPVDATGELDGQTFDGAADVARLLADSPRARACYATRWFEYAVGRPAETADACSLRAVSSRFEASGGDIRALLVDLTLTDAFRFAGEAP